MLKKHFPFSILMPLIRRYVSALPLLLLYAQSVMLHFQGYAMDAVPDLFQ